jgi:hypothetical protein
VGIYGQGANGAGAAGSGTATVGGGGSGGDTATTLIAGLYGGGGAASPLNSYFPSGGGGGGLGWRNNISVSPGTIYTVVVGAGGLYGFLPTNNSFRGTSGAAGAVRLVWGAGKSFPSNAP